MEAIGLSVSSILVVDNDNIIRKAHQILLQNLGYQVDTAENGQKALTLYKSKVYAAVLTDINMPMTGIELAIRIRRLETSKKSTPIIALTTDTTEETKQACLAAGINEVLEKPLKLEVLAPLLTKHLEIEAISSENTENMTNNLINRRSNRL